MTAIALTIAGSDSSGGAGIQADLKTFAALGVYGASAITALTAQNTLGVQGVFEVPPDFVREQMRSVATDFDVLAIEIGMLATSAVIAAVAEGLENFPDVPVVLDPVMVAASGDLLLEASAIETLRLRLLRLATLVTPNLAEAAVLTGGRVAERVEEMKAQALKLRAVGAPAVLVKGGHAESTVAVDIYLDAEGELQLEAPRIATTNTHGTGCTLSAAIAAELAKGAPLREAVTTAKTYITAALKGADSLHIGKGRGPVHHFHGFWPKQS
ncbi:MAG: bifunctional hydroxymethylpyrimidine kinase/phosphomethylpyrimidine kinase [Methyloceanibacter sp.]|uniref:bifunctional hydroxymethylpyrimidine kinase/phosphomethylpyrimidine kinase n=1 Tax=Methyloceanibacter sp. TaxID=1965321 RepID=UPI003D9BC9B0